MPQLNNLNIQNFRLLENLEIARLGQINLFVGKNHAGKSTVLEALCIYESLGSPLLLEQLLDKHDELEAISDGDVNFFEALLRKLQWLSQIEITPPKNDSDPNYSFAIWRFHTNYFLNF